jgi:sugar-phosphatase
LSPVETDAVIFDFDGVIADSTAAVEHQWSEFARHFGLDVLALLADVHGRRSADVLPEWVSPSRIEEATAWMRATAFDHREVALLPGAADAIAAVSTARWAIASSASKELIEGRLQDDGLPLPAALVSASDVTHGKPDPECYQLAAARLGVPPSRCLVVEDAPAGIEAANRAGIGLVIGVRTTHPAEVLQHATTVVPDLSRVRFETEGARIKVAWL